ncbi:NUDIX hydrolase [Streptomyces sp. A10(2020)]|uniref:NUDIX domain-containing protein n=1 Tax=Streptomyces sp. A10(2020) TaxID=2782013 RepID=UPI001F5E1FB8|nr:NUDIX hydrolase [Streptomyces sp. A10(2020)]
MPSASSPVAPAVPSSTAGAPCPSTANRRGGPSSRSSAVTSGEVSLTLARVGNRPLTPRIWLDPDAPGRGGPPSGPRRYAPYRLLTGTPRPAHAPAVPLSGGHLLWTRAPSPHRPAALRSATPRCFSRTTPGPTCCTCGTICLPGGGREPGDRSLAETARRELREETGLDLPGLEPFAVETATGIDGSPVLIQVFTARWNGDPATLHLTEGVLLHWFRPEVMPRLRLAPSTLELVHRHAGLPAPTGWPVSPPEPQAGETGADPPGRHP